MNELDKTWLSFGQTIGRVAFERAWEHQQAKIDALKTENERLQKVLCQCQNALEPYDDIKPRNWITDREKLRAAHQATVAVMEEGK